MKQEDTQQGCNLFARELDEILRHHGTGIGLGQLGSPGLIHPQVVDRLRKSRTQLSFYTLSPRDMQIVIKEFKLNDEEKYRLQAALLATAVAQKLMRRIVPDDAEFLSPEDVFLLSSEDVCRAAEEVFNILLQAMRERGKVKSRSALLAVRKGKGMMTHDPDLLKLETILTRFERAMMALHMSHSARTHEERIEEAKLAQAGFEAVLSQLDQVSPAFKVKEEWRAWRDEAQRSLDESKDHLRSLGA
jgi:hypothetical protein